MDSILLATLNSNMDNLEEVKLYRLPNERERYDNMADCYSLINTIQCLEKAYIKDAVTSKEYTAACSKLLTQFKAAFKQIDKEFKTAEDFLKKYRLECRNALDRIKEDRPITIKDDKGNTHACIAEIVATFITTSDRLKLGQKSMDELLPDLKELHETMGRLTILPPSFEGSNKVKFWIDKMSTMKADDTLSDNEVRQMTYDIDTSYNEFNKFLLEK